MNPIKTPCYVCEEALLERNLKTLEYVQQQSGAKIILALKGFAMWSTFELVAKYLKGCTASGLYEAKLAREEFCKYNPDAEVHTYSPAYKDDEIEEIAKISDHIVFNSPKQLERYIWKIKEINKNIHVSLRVNPEVSSSPVDIYNPCGLYSRLGTTLQNFDEKLLKKIDGLNFHALCEQNVDALEQVLAAFEDKFGRYLKNLQYVNFGGGHHITKKGYDIEKLIWIIKEFRKKYDVDVYLEPGEAVGWETGYLQSTVLDVFQNGMNIAILDTSAEAHMPDTLAMPYRAEVRGAGLADEKKYTYRLGGNTCLAGDIMGDYSFDSPLHVGDTVIFEDQIHYTFVKNTTFNGVKLPSLVIKRKNGMMDFIKEFGYEDYKRRLS
ncbi:carboxynorspermidine decarboxylase [Sulfurimonas sp. SWIR-19]|uniref:carboxynorspermidine decarboxylase n=1 Tax=Sulfurimonas sp. SWIR-19 TaxID=2878390 RepID=UPI001CF5504A|nr:carboxynorspermidine decarboxylase [Sulfurimonas sp. SWIR-19]UCM99304.1 carboxynorspermidine decarboxylase [Sulfurimonas sp. SWIR-19]